MEGAHHQNAVLFDELAMLLGDLKVLLDQAHRRHPADADDDGRAEDGHLVAQPADAGFDLPRGGVPVLGRAALHHIGDVDILLSGKPGVLQHLVQQLAAAPHKGLPLLVLVFSGALPNEQNFCPWGPHAEDHIAAGGCQAAVLALQHLFSQFVQIFVHH